MRAYCDSGHTYEGRIEGFNAGGLLVRVHSLVGFLPFPQLSPSHFCKGISKLRSSDLNISMFLSCVDVLVMCGRI